MPGPYFEGQQPSTCGHYYPDVFRLRDEKRSDGTFVRILDCTVCGQIEQPLDLQSLVPRFVRKLKRKGTIISTHEEDLPAARRAAGAADGNDG